MSLNDNSCDRQLIVSLPNSKDSTVKLLDLLREKRLIKNYFITSVCICKHIKIMKCVRNFVASTIGSHNSLHEIMIGITIAALSFEWVRNVKNTSHPIQKHITTTVVELVIFTYTLN